MFRALLILILIADCLVLSACGQKGPLYMPNTKQPDSSEPVSVTRKANVDKKVSSLKSDDSSTSGVAKAKTGDSNVSGS